MKQILYVIRNLKRTQLLSAHLLLGSIVLALLLLFGLFNSSWIQANSPLVIDSFETNQMQLTLHAPDDIGKTATATVTDPVIIGGERDLEIVLTGNPDGSSLDAGVRVGGFAMSAGPAIEGSARIVWDGPDGDATALDYTGLGGMDLTDGGTQDAFRLVVGFEDQPVDLIIEVFTDDQNSSMLTLSLPGRIYFSPGDFVLPYSNFVPNLGAGADFTNVGAIVMSIATEPGLDLMLDSLNPATMLGIVKSDTLLVDYDGNGQADPGDTLQYTVIITNPDDDFDIDATDVMFNDTLDVNTTLVVSSVVATQGTITSGNNGSDTSVTVEIGSLVDGASTTITFEAIISATLPTSVTQVTNQGEVSGSNFTALPTDDPDTGVTGDPTNTLISP